MATLFKPDRAYPLQPGAEVIVVIGIRKGNVIGVGKGNAGG